MGCGGHTVLTLRQHSTDRGHLCAVKVNNTQVAKRCLAEDNAGDYQNRACDDSTHTVGEDVLEHNTEVAGAKGTRCQNVFLILKSVELHTNSARHTYPSCEYKGEQQGRYNTDLTSQV